MKALARLLTITLLAMACAAPAECPADSEKKGGQCRFTEPPGEWDLTLHDPLDLTIEDNYTPDLSGVDLSSDYTPLADTGSGTEIVPDLPTETTEDTTDAVLPDSEPEVISDKDVMDEKNNSDQS